MSCAPVDRRLDRDREDDPIDRLGVGIVGLGRAAVAMLPSLRRHPDVRIVAGADLDPAAAARFARDHHARAHADLSALLDDPAVDIVYLATPAPLHAAQAREVAQHGKHLVMEKPFATTLHDGHELAADLAEHEIHVVVGHTHGFDPPVEVVADLVAGGTYGELLALHVFAYTDFSRRPRPPEAGGQMPELVTNQLPHLVDVVRQIMGGRIASVSAGPAPRDGRGPDVLAALLKSGSGGVASLTYSGLGHFDSDVWFDDVDEAGRAKSRDTGRARLADAVARGTSSPAGDEAWRPGGYHDDEAKSRVEERQEAEVFHPHLGVTIATCEHADISIRPTGVVIDHDDGQETIEVAPGRGGGGRARVWDEVVDAIRSNESAPHGPRWALETLHVCEAIHRAAVAGGEVTVGRFGE